METLQLTLPFGLEGGLTRREEGADRVRDEDQAQAWITAVPRRVQPPERLDRRVEDPVAPLTVGAVLAVVRQGRDDLDLVLREEVDEVRIGPREQDGQVASVHHVPAEGPGAAHEVAELGGHLRRASGDVHRRDVGRGEHLEAAIGDLAGHVLGPVRPGVHVTVDAGLVAPGAEVELEDVDPGRAKRPAQRLGGERAEVALPGAGARST